MEPKKFGGKGARARRQKSESILSTFHLVVMSAAALLISFLYTYRLPLSVGTLAVAIRLCDSGRERFRDAQFGRKSWRRMGEYLFFLSTGLLFFRDAFVWSVRPVVR